MQIKKSFLILIGMIAFLFVILLISGFLMLQSDHLTFLSILPQSKLMFLVGQSISVLLLLALWPKLMTTVGRWRQWDTELIHLLIRKRWYGFGMLLVMQLIFFL